MALRNHYHPRTEADKFVDGLLERTQRELAKQKAELEKEKIELAQEKAGLAKAKAGLAKAKAGLAKEEAELATINRFKPLSEQESAQFREAGQLASRCTAQLKPRTLLAGSIKKGIQEYLELEELALKQEKLVALQKTLDDIEKARDEENALEQQYADKMAAWKDTLAQIKVQLDELPEDRSPYTAYTKGYDSSLDRFKQIEEVFEKARSTKQRIDAACLTMKSKVSVLSKQLQAESPEHSMGTPPSPVSSMRASITPPRSDSDSGRMVAASLSSGGSSGDVSPERSPKKGALDDEKEMLVANLASAVSYAQPPAAAPAAKKEGLLSKLFSKKTPPALPPKSANNGQALVFK